MNYKVYIFTITLLLFSMPVAASGNLSVVMNTKTYIYHSPSCKWAKRCTKNCIYTTKTEAISHGARPCKVCGG